jgi:signal transduction histidine kinase
MLLQNQISTEWLMNIILGLFLLILLVDWLMFVILLFLGILLGYLCFIISGQELILPKSLEDISLASYMYFYAVVIGVVFSRSHERTHQEKLHTMKMLAGSIAHELRTPLSAMMMDAGFLSKFFPYYQDAYTQAKEAQLPIHKIEPDEEKGMMAVPQNLQTVSRNAHTMITMLLTNLSEGAANQKTEICSMKECVAEALNTYPFSAHERTRLRWDEDAADFDFIGHKEFTKHVLFNLLKNALYAIASVGKGEIFIAIEPATNSKGKNRLIFKDTGSGIPPEYVRHIFDRFYTKKEHGAGIGLAFCQSVIQGFGGEITCTSNLGEHTTFTISLPVLVEERMAGGGANLS